MPTLAKACQRPGCPHNAQRGRAYCADHQPQRDHRWTERERASAAARGYDAKWRRVRAMYLRKHPVCVGCGRPGEEVDHITPLAAGGTHKWENLQTLCKSCHSTKTVRENRGSDGRIQART